MHDETKRTSLTILKYLHVHCSYKTSLLTSYFLNETRDILDLFPTDYISERQNGKFYILYAQPWISKS